MELQGIAAIVTGGGRDIGRAISVKLAAMGANVVTGANFDINGGLAFS